MDASNYDLPRATLKPREERRLLRGHLWAYRNEFQALPNLADGALVDVLTARGDLLGRGFYQAEGGIAVRLLDRQPIALDHAFWVGRLTPAHALRQRLYPESRVYRWVHGESDLLPGLVIDRYDSVVSVQTACAFYEQHIDALFGALQAVDSDVQAMLFQGPSAFQEIGDPPHPLPLTIDAIEVTCFLKGGQKTGMFLDQRRNWARIRALATGERILDGHCHIGMWGLNAAKAGAASVLGVDSSAHAIEMATENAQRNDLSNCCSYACTTVEEVLEDDSQDFSTIILDPPAFAKRRGQVKKALTRYQHLNKLALKKLPPGGFLVSASCSHFVSAEAFLEMLKLAANTARRRVVLHELCGAGPDHPVHLSMPETGYLKCAFLRVLD